MARELRRDRPAAAWTAQVSEARRCRTVHLAFVHLAILRHLSNFEQSPKPDVSNFYMVGNDLCDLCEGYVWQ